MKKIFKYELRTEEVQEIEMFEDYKILSVIEQHNRVFVYVLVDTDSKSCYLVKIVMFVTGQPIEEIEGLTFLGTVSLYEGGFIYHIFCESEVSK